MVVVVVSRLRLDLCLRLSGSNRSTVDAGQTFIRSSAIGARAIVFIKGALYSYRKLPVADRFDSWRPSQHLVSQNKRSASASCKIRK